MAEDIEVRNRSLEILEEMYGYLDHAEQRIMNGMNEFDPCTLHITRLMYKFSDTAKLKNEKLRKRRRFPIIKELKKTLNTWKKTYKPSSTHLVFATLLDFEMTLASYRKDKSLLMFKLLKEAGVPTKDIPSNCARIQEDNINQELQIPTELKASTALLSGHVSNVGD